MSYGACHEVRLNSRVLAGPSTTFDFPVRITPLAGGDEDREQILSQPIKRLKMSFGHQARDLTDLVTAFIMARGGSAHPFVVRDPNDCTAPEKTLWYDLADVHADDRAAYTVDGKIEFPLFRGYESGGHRSYVRITKPCPIGFRMWWGDDEISTDAEVDFARGIIAFKYLPKKGRLYFAGTYDTCVRFDGNPTRKATTNRMHELSGLSLVQLIGKEDFEPSSEADEYRAALGRTDDELSALIENFKELVN